jgi:hypothetical protein
MNRAIQAVSQRAEKASCFSVYLAVPVVIFMAVPPGSSIGADLARFFSPAFSSLLSNINFLLFDRYVFRGLMATGYVMQNRRRILAAVPMALMLVCQLIDILFGMVCGFPERCFRTGLAFFRSTIVSSKYRGFLREGWGSADLLGPGPDHHCLDRTVLADSIPQTPDFFSVLFDSFFDRDCHSGLPQLQSE